MLPGSSIGNDIFYQVAVSAIQNVYVYPEAFSNRTRVDSPNDAAEKHHILAIIGSDESGADRSV